MSRPPLHDDAKGWSLTPSSERWLALDRLRALAVLFMIEGHTTTALLRADELPTLVRRIHEVLHGLTAPAFLFGAGLSFGTATYARFDRFRRLGSSLSRRLSRYAVLLVVGYALQLPGWSLWAVLRGAEEQIALACRVGPLQLIALVLSLAQLAILFVPTPRVHAALAGGLGILVMVGATPLTKSSAAEQLGPFFGAFVRDADGSHFSLFPWGAFVLLGIATAGVLHERPQLRRGVLWAICGAALAAFAYADFRSAAAAQDPGWFWRTSPSYLLFRLGLVVALLGLLHRADDVGRGSLRREWTLLARHSLAAYVVHMVLLFGSPLTPGLERIWGKALSLSHSLVASGLIVLATFGALALLDGAERALRGNAERLRMGLALLLLVVLTR